MNCKYGKVQVPVELLQSVKTPRPLMHALSYSVKDLKVELIQSESNVTIQFH